MRVSAVQFKARPGDPQGSLARLVSLVDEAARDADLVVCPEMALSGYIFDDAEDIRPHCEAQDGRTFSALAPVAAAHGCWIVCGYPEVAGDQLFNSALVIDRTGALVFNYRKTLLFEEDERWAVAGDSGYRTFDTGAGRFGIGICMDLNDDRFIDWLKTQSLDAIAFPTNWVEEGIDVWRYWVWRLQGVSAALVAANTYGTEAHIEFSGASAVVKGPRVLGALPREGDGILRAVV